MANESPSREARGPVDEHRVPSAPGRSVTVYNEYEHGPHGYGRISAAIKRVSWGAIFAGTVVAVVTQFLLNLLGLGIGLTTLEFAGGDDTAGGFGMAQGIWTVVSALIALFTGGWVAGRLAGMPRKTDGMLHGVVTWALTTLLTLFLLTTGVGAIVSGTTSLLSQGINLAGQGISQGVTAVAPEAADVIRDEVDLSSIQQQAQDLLRDIATDPSQAGAAIEEAIDETFGGPGPVTGANRQELIDTIVAQTDLSEAEARQAVSRWEEQYEQARQQITQAAESVREDAPEIAEDVADYVGSAALIAFFALLLGVVAAAVGGAVGSPEDLPAEAVGRPEATGRHV
jgi:ElaB/YqjD/DUF883 family membrane-anchored ribosome-binding protein